MSKILFCISNALASNNSYYITCFYDQFITALAENGNDVLVYVPNLFHTRTFAGENTLKDNIDEDKLRKDIADFAPDLVISFNGSNYRKIFDCVSCPVLLYDADNYSLWNQKDFIKRNKEKYTFFSFSEYGRAEIKQAFSLKDEQIFYVPAATNLKNVKTDQTTNISFIGSFFQINDWVLRDFIENNGGKAALFSVLNEIRQNPFVSSRTILEKYGSAFDDDMKEQFRKADEKNFTCVFSGQNRIAALYELCDMGLELYHPVFSRHSRVFKFIFGLFRRTQSGNIQPVEIMPERCSPSIGQFDAVAGNGHHGDERLSAVGTFTDDRQAVRETRQDSDVRNDARRQSFGAEIVEGRQMARRRCRGIQSGDRRRIPV